MNLELLCHRTLGALFNGGYQGALLAGGVWLCLKLMPRSNAATRHAVWFVTLLTVAALPVVHFAFPNAAGAAAREGADSRHQELAAVRAGTGENPIPEVLLSPAAAAPKLPEASGPVRAADRSLEVDGAGNPEDPLVGFVPAGAPQPVVPVDPVIDTGARTARSAAFSPEPSRSWRLTLPGRAGVALVSVWLLLAIARLGGLLVQLLQLQHLKRRSNFAPEPVRELFASLISEMRLRRKTRLMLCPAPTAPMAVGFWWPAVLLPERVADDADEAQLRHVLRHELAHVARGDDWANLAQQVIKAVLFFHPAVWWLSRRLTLEREIACDDHVLAATRTPRAYALFLTDFAGRLQCRDVAAAPAAWNNKHQLTERIAMILDSKRNSSTRLAGASVGVLTTVTALVAGLALFAAPRLALATEQTAPSEPTESAVGQATDETADPSVDAAVSTDVNVVVAPDFSGSGVAVITAAAAKVGVTPPVATTIVAVPEPESGPRFKPGSFAAAPVALPAPPKPPTATVVFTPQPFPTPAPHHLVLAYNEDKESDDSRPHEKHGPKEPKERDEASLERRLERLERLVGELLGREKGKRGEAMNDLQFNLNRRPDEAKIAKMAEKAAKAGLSEGEIARIKDQAKRDAERAARDVEKSIREAQRASADAANAARMSEQQARAGSEKQVFEIQRKELESQRKGLEKQLAALERQLDRLEEAREKVKQRAEREEHEKHVNRDSDQKEESQSDDSGPRKKTAQ